MVSTGFCDTCGFACISINLTLKLQMEKETNLGTNTYVSKKANPLCGVLPNSMAQTKSLSWH